MRKAFEAAKVVQLAYGVDVSQLLAARLRAQSKLDRYAPGTHDSIVLSEITSVLQRCGVMPSHFRATGNEAVMLQLMVRGAAHDGAFARKVYDALESEHALSQQLMGAIDDALGAGPHVAGLQGVLQLLRLLMAVFGANSCR